MTLLPRIKARQLMALQALLALLESRRHRPAWKRLVQAHGHTLAQLREGHCRGPFFSPAGLPSPGTTEPGPTACAAAATLAHGAPHQPPRPFHSGCAGDLLPSAVRLWLPAHLPP